GQVIEANFDVSVLRQDVPLIELLATRLRPGGDAANLRAQFLGHLGPKYALPGLAEKLPRLAVFARRHETHALDDLIDLIGKHRSVLETELLRRPFQVCHQPAVAILPDRALERRLLVHNRHWREPRRCTCTNHYCEKGPPNN